MITVEHLKDRVSPYKLTFAANSALASVDNDAVTIRVLFNIRTHFSVVAYLMTFNFTNAQVCRCVFSSFVCIFLTSDHEQKEQ